MMVFTLRFGVILLPLMMPTCPAFAQDANRGSALFKQRCQTCHSVTPGQKPMLGPNLSRVAGRKAASSEFTYSTALKASGGKWDKPTLDRFLTAPMKAVPGTRMVISIPDAKQRADIVAYLSSLK
jgi:cytochrome c